MLDRFRGKEGLSLIFVDHTVDRLYADDLARACEKRRTSRLDAYQGYQFQDAGQEVVKFQLFELNKHAGLNAAGDTGFPHLFVGTGIIVVLPFLMAGLDQFIFLLMFC